MKISERVANKERMSGRCSVENCKVFSWVLAVPRGWERCLHLGWEAKLREYQRRAGGRGRAVPTGTPGWVQDNREPMDAPGRGGHVLTSHFVSDIGNSGSRGKLSVN